MPKRASTRPKRDRKRSRLSLRPKEDGSGSFREPNLGRIGASSARDVSFLASYAWPALLPLLGHIADYDVPNGSKSGRKVPSLRQFTALSIARNINSLEKAYLQLAPWECWKMVWERVLELNKDSFEVFRIFASRFSEEQSFSCHHFTSLRLRDASLERLAFSRANAIEECLIPGSGKHRIENLFSNVSLPDFLTYLKLVRFKPRVLLDLSQRTAQMLREDHYLLFNAPYLVGLDLSNSRLIDDHFLYNMATAILRDGKLTQLTILRLQNCPLVTEKGLRHLLDIKDHLKCSLSYIESDLQLSNGFLSKFGAQKDANYVPGTRWRPLTEKDPHIRTISRVPLALKLHCLFRHFASSIIVTLLVGSTTTSPVYLLRSKNAILLDIMLHNEEFSASDYTASSGISKLQAAWETRLAHRNRLPSKLPNCYIVDNTFEPLEVKNQELGNPPEEPSAVFHVAKRKPSNSQRPTKRKKPVGIRTTAESFFNA